MIHHAVCPACKSEATRFCFKSKDFTVSNEWFEIWQCDHCSLRYTQDIPAEQEIGPYYAAASYVSHSDTQEGLINKLYHIIRKRTLLGKYKLVSHFTKLNNGKLLDVGCGTGAFLNTMRSKGWQVTGLEPDAGARKLAEDTYGIEPVPSAELFQLPAESFDAITLWHVLEHVHELDAYLVRLKEILKPGGRLFIAVPNYTSHDASHYQENWAAYDVPRHLYHFSPASMEKLLQLKGFELETIRPMWYDSFYVSMLSEKYKSGRGNLFAAVCTGLISNIRTMFSKKHCSSVIYIIRKKQVLSK